MRPATILALLAALLIGVVAVFYAILMVVDRDGGYEWFYWVAPLLVLAFGGLMLNLTRQYWVKVGKLEVKGKPSTG